MHFRFTEVGKSGVLVPLVATTATGTTDYRKLKDRDYTCVTALPESPFTHGEWKRIATDAGIPKGSFDRHRTAVMEAGLVTQEPDGLYRSAGDSVPNSIRSITPCKGDAAIPRVKAAA
jgi:hypothetical protein